MYVWMYVYIHAHMHMCMYMQMLNVRLTFQKLFDLQISNMKPIHARCLIHAQEHVVLEEDACEWIL